MGFRCRFLLVVLFAAMPLSPATGNASVILVVGDSLSAAYGLPAGQGWVSLLARRLAEHQPPWRVVNASVTGDTSRGGLARLPAVLERESPDIVILELGGNDGLRGINPKVMAANLEAMIRQSRATGARVLLVGVRLPANYGPAFVDAFHQVYYEVAEARSVPLVPFLLEGVALEPHLMQADGIHPNGKAQVRLLENVWPVLESLLEQRSGHAVREGEPDSSDPELKSPGAGG
ncbi:MAG: arylesterase [Pseudomonadota bacterium]